MGFIEMSVHLVQLARPNKIEAKINRMKTIWNLDRFFFLVCNQMKLNAAKFSQRCFIVYIMAHPMFMNYLPGHDLRGYKLRLANNGRWFASPKSCPCI